MDQPIEIPIWEQRLNKLWVFNDKHSDKRVADFIQYHAVSAVRCLVQNENPTMALFVLAPFKIGAFSFGEELREILFWNNGGGSSSRDAWMKHFQTRFQNILISLTRFDTVERGSYLSIIQISLQVFVYAAVVKCASFGEEVPTEFSQTLIQQFDEVLLDIRRWRSARVLICDVLSGEQKTLNYLLEDEFKDKGFSNDFLHAQAKVESKKVSEHTSAERDEQLAKKRENFKRLEKEKNFDEALTALEEGLELAKASGVGAFIHCYVYSMPGGWSFSDTFGCLTQSNVTPEQQVFSLKALNKVLECYPDEIKLLFAENVERDSFKNIVDFKTA